MFKDGKYEPKITKEVAELFYRDASKYEIKTFDIQGVKLDLFNKYRELIQKKKQDKVTSSSFQETARPFLVFYNELPKYVQQTKSLDHDTLTFRRVIKNAKELEKTFFEELPFSFGLSLQKLANSEDELDAFIDKINTYITQLRTAEEALVERIEKHLLKVIGIRKASFEKYKAKIQQRYNQLTKHHLYPRQKTFVSRLNSKLSDKKAWINSLVQVLIDKRLNEISDEEEMRLLDRIETTFHELDNLLELSKVDFNEETEEVIKVEITSSAKEVFQKNIILSKEQKRGAKALEKKLKGVLKGVKDQKMSQAILIKLLKELIQNE